MTQIAYDERGLVPVVVQDDASGEILMLAYANAEAVALTLSSGELHLWSRSRAELWHKGASSGNTQSLVALRLDCDGDALLAIVRPAGPACHTGERSCFFDNISGGEVPHEALPTVERVLVDRAREKPSGSYLTALLHSRGHSLADAQRVLLRRRR